MIKYFIPIVMFPYALIAQQSKKVYYASPYLQIENVYKKTTSEGNDFGYNMLTHADNTFLKEGFFMWVDDQWYEILNGKDIFTPYKEFNTLFTISVENKNPLKIKDVNDVIYLFPIEALDGYKVSYNDFIQLSETVVKKNPVAYQKATAENKIPDITLLAATSSSEKEVLGAVHNDLPKLNQTIQEEVLITSEDPASVLLDVIDVVEVVKREEIPFEPGELQSDISVGVSDVPKVINEETVKEKAAKDTPIIIKPANDYEVAVNEGFEGTVTEWIEMIDAKGGKTAYQQAVDKGFVGNEDEWMKSLWGRQVDVEIAKRDKTTAIVSEWIQSLKMSKGSSPYELALKHGFYGTFTEWVESVIGNDGEKAYAHAQTQGFEGSYKEWIEKQLNNSNKEILRKERLAKTQMFVAPNVLLQLKNDGNESLTFDLFDYYNQFYGAAVISSDGQTEAIDVKATDLEYQITWFEKDKIKVLELSKEGIIKYQALDGVGDTVTKINIRYILK